MENSKTYTTKDLYGKRVVGGKKGTKRIGKVRRFVFHPSEKRCLGFFVKRPDLLLMFRRKDLFVPVDGFEWEDGRVRLSDPNLKDYNGPAVCKELGIEWDRCTMWEAMPILTEDGEEFGRVGNVEFLKQSGKVTSIIADKGAFDKALLGQLEIPAAYIRGFKLGVGGTEIVNDAEPEEGEVQTGAILVSDEVRDIVVEGGLAEKGGKAAAVAQNKVNEAKEKAAPKVHEAAHAANEASQKAAYVTGRQIGRTKGMFTDFKNSFDKALNGEDDGESKGE